MATIFRFCFVVIVLLQLVPKCLTQTRRSGSGSLIQIEDISDQKEFKKLLRVKTNVLALFAKSVRDTSEVRKIISGVAIEMKGQATLVFVDCGSEGKKLCKKFKIFPDPYALKHYKDGEFHKDYDRKITVKSMVNFLKDPSGDIPWEEEESAQDIIHISDVNNLEKLLRKEKLPIMVMFYAPWCGFCKRLKPDYSAAATELKGQSVLAAMDVNKPENNIVRHHFNITGFPTLLFFEDGKLKYRYEGENNKDGIVNFMKNPGKAPEKPKDPEWSEVSSDVVHLTDASFNSTIQEEESVLVMFYAPWCGHCKKMKPEYINAASMLKEQSIPGVLAAVDATKHREVADRFKITGYPTVKYFKDGEFAFDANVRTAEKIVEFMQDPKEPLPPPPPEIPWHEKASDVVHLNEENFKSFLRRKKHVLVMFYAPWCGHCKNAKPEYEAAATHFKEDPKVELAAVDCIAHASICNTNDVKGYPTFKYFSYYKTSKAYEGGRKELDFVAFMKDPQAPLASSHLSPPSLTPEQWWSEHAGAENLHHLNGNNFKDFIQKELSVLVMFYAPWCGHCKAMKPAYAEAATLLKKEGITGVLAAVDATGDRELATLYEVKGFPTLKYFQKGQMIAEYDRGRTVEELVSFMKSPPKLKEEL